MSDSRSWILERIAAANRALDASPDEARDRLSQPPVGPQPAWSEPAVDRFVARLERAAASVSRAGNAGEAVAQVVAYLEQQRIEPEIVIAPHPLLGTLDWPDTVKVRQRTLQGEDTTVLSIAYAGVAETGSVVMQARPETPTGFNFLPETHLCVIETHRIVDHLEDVWGLMRKETVEMPRSLNFVTGPSRTADVEQTIQLGAHGPRRFHAILLGD